MSHDDALLVDILNAARKAKRFVEGMSFEEFAVREEVQSGVFWQIGVIGEAARHVSDTLRKQHPEIPFFEMAGMRNRLVHDYKRIDLEQVWGTLGKDVPEMIAMIAPLVSIE
jgi:uncharacterized protein with HEPN domain